MKPSINRKQIAMPSQLDHGTTIVFTGLKGAAHLNGQRGRVLDYLPERERQVWILDEANYSAM